MSIGSFVSASLESLHQHRYDVAIALASSAVDATAKKTEVNDRNSERYKKFLQKNMRIITRFGFPGIEASGIRIKCINVPELKVGADNKIGIEDVLYHTIRCGLIHQCELDDRIEFTHKTIVGDIDGKFKLPIRVIDGLLMAVVLDLSNKNERLGKDYEITFGNTKYLIDKLWGLGKI